MADDLALDHLLFQANQQLDNDLLNLSRDLARDRTRLEAVNHRQDQILAAVAHDLRTPLGTIVGFVDVLRRKLAAKLDDEDRVLLDRIEAQSGRMLQMAEDLVDASAIERGIVSLELSQVAVRPLLEELIDINGPVADRKAITLSLDVRGELPMIRVDRNRITQVVDNLLSNAIKFTPADQGATITVAVRVEGDELRIEVADQGVGIEPELQARLFEPFARAGAAGTDGEPSTGLGLAISRSLARAHGGDITLVSQVEVGTTVTVRLPLDPPDPAPATLDVPPGGLATSDADEAE